MLHDIDGILKHLEEGYENELSYLADTGAAPFSTADLIRLKGQWQVKHQLFYLMQRRLIRIVACSPVPLVVGFILFFGLGWVRLGVLIAAFFPLALMLFVAGMYFLKTQFKGEGHKEWVGKMIDEEIERRKKR